MKALRLAPIALLVLSGCGGDDSGGDAIDAAPGPDADPAYACAGPLPTEAPAMITLSGAAEAVTAGGSEPLAGVALTAFDENDEQVATDVTGKDGTYAIELPTGGAPLDGYVRAEGPKNDPPYLVTYLYPPNPLFADTDDGRLALLDETTFNLLKLIAGVEHPRGSGVVAVLVLDCQGNTVEGATVSTDPAGEVRYADGSVPNADRTATDAGGTAIVFSLRPGEVEIQAAVGGVELRAHTVNVVADAFTTTAIAPGPVN